jgi:hypothetical protein
VGEIEVFHNSEVGDTVLSTDEMEALPMVGRKPWPKSKSKSGMNKVSKGPDEGYGNTASRVMKLPMSPDPAMLKFDRDNKKDTLVTWLPYSSIDVVFNHENVYANHQNHNPAFISYNFTHTRPNEIPKSKWHPKWFSLVEDDDTEEIKPVTPSVKLLPAMKASTVQHLRTGLSDELKEAIRMNRQNAGMDTSWAHQPDFVKSIELFLDMWEIWMQLDIDMEPLQDIFQAEVKEYQDGIFKPEPQSSEGQRSRSKVKGQDDIKGQDDDNSQHDSTDGPEFEDDDEKYFQDFIKQTFRDDFKRRYCNIYGAPNFGGELQTKGGVINPVLENQVSILQDLKKSVLLYKKTKFESLVKRGYIFEGFPVHISDPEPEVVRLQLMRLPEFQSYLKNTNDDIMHTVVCKLYALPAKLLSGWVYIGIQLPAPKDDG